MLCTAHLLVTCCKVSGTGSQSCHFSGSEPVRYGKSVRSIWQSVSYLDRQYTTALTDHAGRRLRSVRVVLDRFGTEVSKSSFVLPELVVYRPIQELYIFQTATYNRMTEVRAGASVTGLTFITIRSISNDDDSNHREGRRGRLCVCERAHVDAI